MTVSFVVIAYNEERSIERTVRAILAQDGLNDFEIIVVNDGSRDQTLEIVQRLSVEDSHIRVVDQPNKGRGAARSAGIQAATGDYLAFVDADIVLPADWFSRCLPYLKDQGYDACAGTALPDGDVSFVHRITDMEPKLAAQTTTVTGSNGLFKRSVFEKVSYDASKRNGEDVALGYAMQAAGIKTITVPGLVVDHREYKSYADSLSWLFESGIGASRQFYEHREIRLPDIAFAGFLGLLLLAILLPLVGVVPWWAGLIVLFLYVSATSLMHLRGKFYLERTPLRSLFGLLINDTLIAAYYIGRAVGMTTEWKK